VLLALTCAVFWGVLPIALDLVLAGLDPYTITWCRFASATLALGAILGALGGLPRPHALGLRVWRLLGVALIGLTGNYVLYIVALSRTSPTTAQTVIQLGPTFLLFGGLLVYKERFSGRQWIGFVFLVGGLALFFNDRFSELANPSAGVGLGVTMLVLGALVWAFYGLAQKRLLNWLGAQQILLCLYAGAAIVLLPWTSLGDLSRLTNLQVAMLVFCCINTTVAYGAFAEGLKHLEVSRFGAILATSPLFTAASMWFIEKVAPALVVPERLNGLSMAGILLVVGGSATCALARDVN
jgi:drug/metabolite transporter (DMT)-like permease